MNFVEAIRAIDSFLWGDIFIILTVISGFYLAIGSKFFSFRHLGHIFKATILKKPNKVKAQKGALTPFEAMCVALGGCVGTGNISGVAAAIAVGGPGAVFWLWLYALLGMTIKVVEVTLGCYYRSRTPDGDYFGGPTYYIEKGLGPRFGKKILPMAYMFGTFLFMQWFAGGSLYAAAESAQACFNISPLIYIGVYAAFLIFVTIRGKSRIGHFAAKAVPIMTVLYLLGGITLMVVNITEIPHVFSMIFSGAFSGTAASGGFAGASVRLAVQKGLSRSVNSNEAGQGSSPMIHATADTMHPVQQGLWGAIEVFLDTIVVCTITSTAILSTGVWNSGLTSATLTISAFESVFGSAGAIFIVLLTTVFAFTTNSGWFTYFNTVLNFFLRNHEKARQAASSIFRKIYTVPVVVFSAMLFYTDAGANVFWDIIDAAVALPTYINLLSLMLLSGTFFQLLKDYKARYLHIGEIDPSFKYFYDTEPNEAAKEYDRELIETLSDRM